MQIIHKTSLLHLQKTLNLALLGLDQADQNRQILAVNRRVSSKFANRMRKVAADLSRAATAMIEPKRYYQCCLQRRNEDLEQLSHLVRDFWLVLRRRIRSERLSEAVLVLYRVPLRAPSYLNAENWLQHAQNLVHGEALAREQGYPPMRYPDPDLLAQQLEQARTSVLALNEAKLACLDCATELRAVQREAERCLRGLAYRLKENTRDLTAPARRELMRTYGYRFKAVSARDQHEETVPIAEPTTEQPTTEHHAAEQPKPVAQAPKADLPGPDHHWFHAGIHRLRALVPGPFRQSTNPATTDPRPEPATTGRPILAKQRAG